VAGVTDLSPLVVVDGDEPLEVCGYGRFDVRRAKGAAACALPRREVRAFGAVPREGPPDARCPIGVRVLGDHVVAEPRTFGNTFDPLPFRTCVPVSYAIGARHVVRVDDGFLVAYDSAVASEVLWTDDEGREWRLVSKARIAGFARAPSGAPLALAIGRARLGRGAVVTFEKAGGPDARGAWTLRIVRPLPLPPQSVAFDDGGAIVGFAGGFVFRADEHGRIENLYYVPRDLGRVASIARTKDGRVYLGLECGVLELAPAPPREGEGTPPPYVERWWSARDGASGRWRDCAGPGSSS
jgi:hypothetical protein